MISESSAPKPDCPPWGKPWVRGSYSVSEGRSFSTKADHCVGQKFTRFQSWPLSKSRVHSPLELVSLFFGMFKLFQSWSLSKFILSQRSLSDICLSQSGCLVLINIPSWVALTASSHSAYYTELFDTNIPFIQRERTRIS